MNTCWECEYGQHYVDPGGGEHITCTREVCIYDTDSYDEEYDKLKKACKRMLEGSIPYVMAHGAFLIRASDWEAIAELVIPGMRELNKLSDRVNRGENPTKEEVEEALKIFREDDPEE